MTIQFRRGASHKLAWSAALALICGCASRMLLAQEQESNRLEEVIVTAQKRAQRAQDVALTMQAYSANQLQDLGVVAAPDLVKFTPGLNAAGANAGQTLLFGIRGVVQQDFSGHAESPVAVYVDDGYIATNTVVGVKLFDIDRVEVLKGPQGTLFGRNATGGIVNIFSKLPTDTPEGYGELTYGSYDDVKAEGAFGAPISETVKLRVAGAYHENGAYVRNINAVGEDLGASDDVSVRSHLAVDPHEALKILLTGYYSRSNWSWGPYFSLSTRTVQNPGGQIVNSIVVDQPTLLGTEPSDARGLTIDADNARDSGGRAHLKGGTVKISWDFGPLLTSITDLKRSADGTFVDNDASPVPFIDSNNNNFSNSFTQELRLYGAQQAARWYTGLYYLRVRSGMDPNRNWIFPAGVMVEDWLKLQTDSYSAFGQLEYDVGPRATLIGGLRVTQEDKVYDYRSEAFTLTGLDSGPARTPFHGDSQDTMVSAKLQFEFRPMTDVLLYAGWNRGAKAGSFNAPFAGGTAYPDSAIPYDPETLDAFEIGAKSTFLDGLVQLNGALFYYDYQDYQAFRLIGLSTQISNNRAEVYGGEVDLVARPVRALTLRATASYTHDRVYDVFLGNPELVTRVAPYTSDWKWTALAKYDFAVADGTLSVQGDLQNTGPFWFSLSNYDATRVKGYTLANARLSWISGNGAWEASVFGKNLTDKRYGTVGFDLSALCGCSQIGYGQPRWYGASLRRNF